MIYISSLQINHTKYLFVQNKIMDMLKHVLFLAKLTFVSLSHSFNLSLNHITLDMLNNFCFNFYPQNSLSHSVTLSQSVTLTLTHSHTLSMSHSITLDMLNKFCFHLYAQKSLFIGENCNAFFLTAAPSPSPVTFEFIELVPS